MAIEQRYIINSLGKKSVCKFRGPDLVFPIFFFCTCHHLTTCREKK